MSYCKEKKQFLFGGKVIYNCELVSIDKQFGILKYIVGKKQQVGSLFLQPGIISYGFYWIDRPYVLYKWLNKNGGVVANYFNLADLVKLSEQEFSWRDLIVDILVLPTGQIEVLDEDEIPKFINKSLQNYIELNKQMLLKNCQRVIAETSTILNKYIFTAGSFPKTPCL